jgi:glutamate synthase (ferredoxin)
LLFADTDIGGVCACLQVFINGKPGQTGDDLERQLFIVRKLLERAKTAAMGAAAEDFYVCTLSNRTIVYKVRRSALLT